MIFAHLFQIAANPPTAVSALESSISPLERAISALESRSVPWEHLVWVFTFLVVVGVALELWVIRRIDPPLFPHKAVDDLCGNGSRSEPLFVSVVFWGR